MGPEYTCKVDSAGLADGLEGMCWRKISIRTPPGILIYAAIKMELPSTRMLKGYWKSRFWGEQQEFSLDRLILRDLGHGGGVKSAGEYLSPKFRGKVCTAGLPVCNQ